MNYIQVLSSLIGGLRGQKYFRTFRKKRNNNGWILLSFLGVSILGILGGRNKKLSHQFLNGYKNVKQAFEKNLKENRNPLQTNLNIATEIAEEIKPDILGNKQGR